MNASYRISRLTKSDKPLFVTLMCRAFARDPLFLHAFGDMTIDREARSRLTSFVSFLFNKSLMLHEEVWGYFENESLLGTYIVENPHAGKLPNRRFLRLFWRTFPFLFRFPGKTLGFLNSYMRITRSAAPSFPHHYLIMIGVEPEAQGRGIGKALMLHLLSEVGADTDSQGIALDTENEKNVSLYKRFGFTLSGETQVGGLPVYAMVYCKEGGQSGYK